MATAEKVERFRVLVADDHVIVRQALSKMLKSEPDMEVVGEASEGQAAIELTRRLRPDVVLMDVSMRGMSGVEATRAIHSEMPDVQVIGLSMFEEGEEGVAMRRAGAVNYISKAGPSHALIAAIRACRPR